MVVQHNLRAMNSNRMLGLTANVQAKSTEKLSSGYKINRAADDAAGLSISEKMRKQIRGLSQASLNAQDGISAVQTAEGALNEVQDMLQRMNELAVKAANGTMSESDRSYIQNEIDQLTTEIDRVAETTKFNETYLLKGVDGTETVETEASVEVGYAEGITGEKKLEWVGGAQTLYATKEGKSVAITAQNYKDFFEANEVTEIDKVTIDKESKLYDKNGTVLSADAAKTALKNGDKVYSDVGTEGLYNVDYEDKQDVAVEGVDYTYTAATSGKTSVDVSYFGDFTKAMSIGGKAITLAAGKQNLDGLVDAINAAGIANTKAYVENGRLVLETASTDGKVAGAAIANTAIIYDTAGANVAATTAQAVATNGQASAVTFKNTSTFYKAAAGGAYADEAEVKAAHEAGTTIYTSPVYQDAKDGHTLYDAEGNVMDKDSITAAHLANTTAAPDVKLFTKAPTTAEEGKDYTVETTTKDVISVKDGYEIYNVAADENTQFGNQDTAVNAATYSAYMKMSSDFLLDDKGNTVDADKLKDYFDEAGKYKGGLYRWETTGAPTSPTEIGAEQIDDYVKWTKTEASSEEVAVNNALTLSLQVGADSTVENKISVDIESMGAENLGVAGLKVDGKDSTNADAAVETIAAAIEKVSAQRSALGAVQNRLEHTIANLDNVVENTTAAESQIRDTDMATEMVKFSNNNILAQAGQAMLAQANQANQGVLSLLG